MNWEEAKDLYDRVRKTWPTRVRPAQMPDTWWAAIRDLDYLEALETLERRVRSGQATSPSSPREFRSLLVPPGAAGRKRERCAWCNDYGWVLVWRRDEHYSLPARQVAYPCDHTQRPELDPAAGDLAYCDDEYVATAGSVDELWERLGITKRASEG